MAFRKIIRAEHGQTLPPAAFKSFDRRPVNYYRDIFSDEDHSAAFSVTDDVIQSRIEEALAAQREQLRETVTQETHKQFTAGLAQGRAEATAELKRGLELLANYTKILQAEKAELAAQAEKSSIELAFQIAQKVIGHEIQTKPEQIGHVVKNAIRQVLDCDQIRLRVNADDLNYLRSIQADLQDIVSGDVKLDIRTDESVERGGCMIETEHGTLDARISSQLETLRQSLAASEKAGE